MPRRSFRGRSRRSSSRRTLWVHSLFQGNGILSDADGQGNYNWFSFWSRFPSGYVDNAVGASVPNGSDETLVRTIVACTLAWTGAAASFEPPIDLVFGLIAFDGGNKPDFYDLATFGSGGSFVAPPHPVVNASDDWIIRIPANFVADASYASAVADPFVMSRAMRKLPTGMGILGVVAPYSVLDSPSQPTISWSIDIRHALRSGYTLGAGNASQ